MRVLRPEDGRSGHMAKTPVSIKKILKRITEKNEQLRDETDILAGRLAELIEKSLVKGRRALKKAALSACRAFSYEKGGIIAKYGCRLQEISDYWVNLTCEQFERDKRFIRVYAKKAARHISALVMPGSGRGLGKLASSLVSRYDFVQEIVYDNLYFLYTRIRRRAVSFIEMLWDGRMTVLKYGTVGLIVVICMISVFNYATGYEYSYNGRVLGLVKNQETVSRVVEVAAGGLAREYGVDVQVDINRDFSFRKVVTMDRHTDDADEVLAKITYMQDTKATAYGIFADGSKVATVDSENTAENILSDIMERYTESDVKYDYIGFKEDVAVDEITTTLGKLMNSETAENVLLAGGTPVEYKADRSDTVTSIRKKFKMTSAELKALNPDISDAIENEDTVLVSENSPYLTVVTRHTEKYYEKKDYKTKRVKTDSLYEGETKIHQKGVKGKVKITAVVECENGVETARDVVAEKVVKEPVTRIIYVGTKKRPSYVGSGNLINPCPAGYVSSGFGARWGRLHRGIDLACGVGNPIYAADGGIVVTASYNYSYGYYVKINHQNGMVTTYAHCSELLVSAGQKVGQGQQIARVGNTGNSTGAHCHFEVEVNGVLKNPASYL